MRLHFRRILYACLYLISGTAIGLMLLEGVLRSNPTLLPRGIDRPISVDAPLTITTYDVQYSDADVYYWRPDLVKPVFGNENKLESHVIFETDEFGFRNFGPISPQVDVVVLGRSISVASHLMEPWPYLLQDLTGWRVFNLSEPGSGISAKHELFRIFGSRRNPELLIIEIVPSIDIAGKNEEFPLISQELFVPVIQKLLRNWITVSLIEREKAIFPLSFDIVSRRIDLTCCIHYLDFYSLDEQTLAQSNDWIVYRSILQDLVNDARTIDACIALLYTPTKTDVYFPLAKYPDQLSPTLNGYFPKHLDADSWIEVDLEGEFTVETIIKNSFSGRDLIEKFARENNLVFIDPSKAMVQSILDGHDPFMVYDSHWNQLGHQIVADEAIKALRLAGCN